MALIMWLLGAAVAATGSAVYLEYGTVSPLLPSEAIAYVLSRDTCYEEWKNKNEKLPKKVFEEYYRALPKDEKEVYHIPSVLILSDASWHDSHTSHGQRLFKYVTIAFFVQYNHLTPRSTGSDVGPELAYLVFVWVCSERGGRVGPQGIQGKEPAQGAGMGVV